MMKWIFILGIVFCSSASAQTAHKYLPKSPCTHNVEYTYFTLCYSFEHRQAVWTYHKLTKESISGSQKRTNDYRMDPQMPDPVQGWDYKGSGYDRGHLVPAADRKQNYVAMSETFFMTNMSPQKPSFNRGVWRRLEEKVRSLVKSHGPAYVVTAPVLFEELKKIRTGVSIPKYFYKIAFFPDVPMMKGYLLKNQKSTDPVEFFEVSVDSIEEVTGFDFFSELPDDLEETLESAWN